MIDFAFSLVAGEALTTPLPIGRQQDYPYQSPRLLAALEAGRHGDLGPTRQLDWRCDLYSVAAMLARYLPATASRAGPAAAADWTPAGLAAARTLIERIRHFHDQEPGATRPHAELIALCAEALADADMAASLDAEWTLASGTASSAAAASPTPVTRSHRRCATRLRRLPRRAGAAHADFDGGACCRGCSGLGSDRDRARVTTTARAYRFRPPQQALRSPPHRLPAWPCRRPRRRDAPSARQRPGGCAGRRRGAKTR